jgi:flagellar motor switch protein FliM
MTTDATSVLRKKLSRIQSRGYNFPIQNQLAAKVEYAAARGSTAALGVTAEAIVEDSRVTRLAPLIDALPMPGLFMVMHAKAGDLALAGFDMHLVDHVVDILAGGDPSNVESRPTRKPTALDASLCMPAVDAILNQLYAELEALGQDVRVEPFEVIQTEHIPTNLSYVLSEQQHLSFRVNLDIGDSARTGYLYLVLPLSWIEPIEAVLLRSNLAPAHADSMVWRRHMRNVARLTPVKLNAVVDSFGLQVADLARLQTGKLFLLSVNSLDDVRLQLQIGGETRAIATGRLGIYKRNKAIKVLEPLEGALFEALGRELCEVDE